MMQSKSRHFISLLSVEAPSSAFHSASPHYAPQCKHPLPSTCPNLITACPHAHSKTRHENGTFDGQSKEQKHTIKAPTPGSNTIQILQRTVST